MPRTKIPPSDEEFDRMLLCNVEYELGMKGYDIMDLKEILGCSNSLVYNRRRKPDSFEISELKKIAKCLRIPIENFFFKKVPKKEVNEIKNERRK